MSANTYDCLHSKTFTVCLVRCIIEDGFVRCGVAAFAANLPVNNVVLYDLKTGAEVCAIALPEPAIGMNTPEAWTDEQMGGELIDIERVG